MTSGFTDIIPVGAAACPCCPWHRCDVTDILTTESFLSKSTCEGIDGAQITAPCRLLPCLSTADLAESTGGVPPLLQQYTLSSHSLSVTLRLYSQAPSCKVAGFAQPSICTCWLSHWSALMAKRSLYNLSYSPSSLLFVQLLPTSSSWHQPS